MKENKNLDKLFQEKFKSLDYQPKEIVWENIEEQLKEKKKKRVIPFWWKFSGIAATLVLGLGLLNIVFDNSQNNSIVNSEEIKNVNSNVSSNPNEFNNVNKNNNVIVHEENTIENNKIQSEISNNSSTKKDVLENNIIKNNTTEKNSVVAISDKKDKNQINKSVIQNNRITDNYKTENFNKEIGKSKKESNEILKNNSSIVTNQIENNTKNTTNLNVDNNTIQIENKIASNENIKDVIKEIEEIKKIDSTSIASVVPNAMEELLNEKEKKTIKEPKLNRWQLSSNVAPIYFSSSSNGSPLDEKFKDNTKQFNTNVGYGIGVKYALNKKVKIRTGVNSLVADYNTNDVVIYQNSNASKIEHVDSNLRGSLMQIENKSLETIPTLEANGGLLKKYDSSLNQKIGYIEVPLELSYKVLDKKFGIEVIGGVSSLFLNQNEVSVITSGTEMTIGKANNLNSIHFSGNLGLGLKYNLWKKFDAHVEPIFKYQVNTFNNDSGNFKPYVFGIYSGLSYTF